MYDNRHHLFKDQYNHKLFAHANRWGEDVFGYLNLAKPKIVKFLDANVDAVKRARDLLPDALLILRRHTPVQNLGNNQDEARQLGRDFAAQIASEEAVKRGYVDLVESYNEVLGETANPLLHKRFDHFQIAFREGLQGLAEPVAFNFGTGNMSGQQLLELYPETLAAYKWLGFHEYDWPTMDRTHLQGLAEGNGGMWRCLRYRRIMRDVIAALGDNWSVVVTECGMTQIVHAGAQDVGYAHPENTVSGPWGSHPTPISPEDYFETLKWYSDELMKDRYVAGACMFVTGGTSDWQSFETIPQVTNLINQQQIIQEENGDEPMADIWVEDLRQDNDGSLGAVPRITTFEQLQQHFGLEIDTTFGEQLAQDGEWYWALVGFRLQPDTVIYQPEARNADRSPAQVLMWRRWPGSPVPNSPPNPPYFSNGVGGFTDANGTIGWEFTDSSVTGDDGGPDNIWVNSDPVTAPSSTRRVGSDCAKKLGWHGATNHLKPNPVFIATQKGGNGGTTPPPSTGDNVIELRINGQSVYRAQWAVSVQEISL